MRPLILLLAVAALSLPGSAQGPIASSIAPVLTNERVTVRDVTFAPGMPGPPEPRTEDRVMVFLRGGQLRVTDMAGKRRTLTRKTFDAIFDPRGKTVALEAVRNPVRAILIDLHDLVVPPLVNRSGLPEGFPRPGAKKLLETNRVVVWEYTFTPGKPSPMHFHSRDVVTIYSGNGTLQATTPAGETTLVEHVDGEIKFNPRNRAHTEVLTRGNVHIIAVELK